MSPGKTKEEAREFFRRNTLKQVASEDNDHPVRKGEEINCVLYTLLFELMMCVLASMLMYESVCIGVCVCQRVID